ncbi:MAG TPA: hypothetical protein VF310_00390, partial [Vicinamibacteria bacterium]
YVATLARLGFDVGPRGVMPRDRAVDAMGFISGKARRLEATRCGDVLPPEHQVEVAQAAPAAQVAQPGTTPGFSGTGDNVPPPLILQPPVPPPPSAPPTPGPTSPTPNPTPTPTPEATPPPTPRPTPTPTPTPTAVPTQPPGSEVLLPASTPTPTPRP